jgi:hypothetical protein
MRDANQPLEHENFIEVNIFEGAHGRYIYIECPKMERHTMKESTEVLGR